MGVNSIFVGGYSNFGKFFLIVILENSGVSAMDGCRPREFRLEGILKGS